MLTLQKGPRRNWIEVLGCIVLVGTSFLIACSRTPQSTSTANSPKATSENPANANPEMREFLRNRATLAAKMSLLNNPNPQAIKQFQKDNADLLKRQRELAQVISAQQASTPSPEPPPLQMPSGASPQLQAFLKARDQIMRDHIAFTNQPQNDDPATRLDAEQKWQEQNASKLQQNRQLAQALEQQQNTTPLPLPPSLRIPPGTSPQLQAFLKARDQLMRDEIAFNNKHLTDDPAARQIAEEKWRIQNADHYRKLQQLAEVLSAASLTVKGNQ